MLWIKRKKQKAKIITLIITIAVIAVGVGTYFLINRPKTSYEASSQETFNSLLNTASSNTSNSVLSETDLSVNHSEIPVSSDSYSSVSTLENSAASENNLSENNSQNSASSMTNSSENNTPESSQTSSDNNDAWVNTNVEINDNFILLSGGAFTMGSPDGKRQRGKDELSHTVTLNPFYVAPYEVTQKDYSAVTGKNPSVFKGNDLPVDNVTWYEAVEYCNKLSEQCGLAPVYQIIVNFSGFSALTFSFMYHLDILLSSCSSKAAPSL